mgnify:FL=1
MTNMRKFILFALFVLAVLVADVVVKARIERWLEPYQLLPLAGDSLRLTLTYNPGVAFGLLRSGGISLLLLSGGIIVALGVWAGQMVRQGRFGLLAPLALGLALGGAVANFLDRLVDGRVTDYLDMGVGAWRWPAYNLADSAILLGLGLWLLLSLRHAHAAG